MADVSEQLSLHEVCACTSAQRRDEGDGQGMRQAHGGGGDSGGSGGGEGGRGGGLDAVDGGGDELFGDCVGD